jgi:hypothetical protein
MHDDKLGDGRQCKDRGATALRHLDDADDLVTSATLHALANAVERGRGQSASAVAAQCDVQHRERGARWLGQQQAARTQSSEDGGIEDGISEP